MRTAMVKFTPMKMDYKSYYKLAQLYRLLKDSDHTNSHKNTLAFKAILDNEFSINYRLPVDSFFVRRMPQYVGNTVMHFAVLFYNKFNGYCLYYLMDCNSNFNIQNNDGITPLILSLIEDKGRCVDIFVKRLLTKKIFTNFHCKNGISHFHAACSTDCISLVDAFISSGVSVDECVNHDSPNFAGYSALHFAMIKCQPKIVKLLLEKGADFNKTDASGLTPLHLLIKTLIRKKNSSLPSAMKQYIENGIKNNIFSMADYVGLSRIHLLSIFTSKNYKIKSCEDVNSTIQENSHFFPGYTPLHFAAQLNIKSVLILLEKGADLTIKDSNGTTPFDLCLKKFNTYELIEILLKEQKYNLSTLKFSNGSMLKDFLVAIKNSKLEEFFSNNEINTSLPVNAPLGPNYSLFHIAICLSSNVDVFIDNKASIKMLCDKNMSPLHIAFQTNKAKVVKQILKEYSSSLTNLIDQENLSHLHIACAAKDQIAMQHLLNNGADPNLRTKCDFEYFMFENQKATTIKAGSTPLHIAAHVSCVSNCKAVSILLLHGANPNVADDNSILPYHIALKFNRGDIFNEMLRSDDKHIGEKGYEKLGLTKLKIACVIRDIWMAKEELKKMNNLAILDEPIKLDSPIWPGDTALHIVCKVVKSSRNDFLKLLIQNYADPCIQNAEKSTPFHLNKGELFQSTKLMEVMKGSFYYENPMNNQGFSHFHLCCKANNLFSAKLYLCLKSYLVTNVPVDYFADCNDAGFTPLHYAVKNKNLELIEELLDYRAHPNSKNTDGLTPLLMSLSLKGDYTDTVQKLLSCYVTDIHEVNLLGENALEIILQTDPINMKVLDILLDMNITIDCTRFIEEKPWRQKLINQAICKISNIKTFSKLFGKISNLITLDSNGKNAVHHMSSAKFPDTALNTIIYAIQTLINNGSEFDQTDMLGKTPLHLATSSGSIIMVKVLLYFGADINIKDDYGKTPYEYIPNNLEELKLIFKDYVKKAKEIDIYVYKSEMYAEVTVLDNHIKSSIHRQLRKFDREVKKKTERQNLTAYHFFAKEFVDLYETLEPSLQKSYDEICTASDLCEKFDVLCPFIRVQFNRSHRAMKKRKLLNLAPEALKKISGFYLDEMIREIIGYLNECNMRNLCDAVKA